MIKNMNRQDLKKYQLPDEPGVYLFKKGRTILYVGKATSLRDRVKSYFSKDLILTRGPKVLKMVDEATLIDWQATDSVLEALILEANLIKKYEPKANTDGKDDKSFNFVVITNEDFPIVKTERGKKLLASQVGYKYIFGPYPHGAELKEALKIIQKIFPYRDEKCLSRRSSGGGCFNYQIGLCPGTCVGKVSKKDYAKVIRSIRLFFEGKKDRLIDNLTAHMNRLAKARQFEEAGEFKKKIFALRHIQDVALLKQSSSVKSLAAENPLKTNFRIESYDVSHISGREAVGVMVVMIDGELSRKDYRKFKLHHRADDLENLREMLERRLKHLKPAAGETGWVSPDLIVVDGGNLQQGVFREVLQDWGLVIPIVAVTKDAKHRPREIKGRADIVRDYHREIISINQETHRFAVSFHRRRRDSVL